MIETILNYKWYILLFSEIMGWVFTIVFVFARYFFQSKVLSWVSVLLIAMLDYIPSIVLPIIDAFYINNFKEWIYGGGLLFDLAIIALIIFSVTLGKKYLVILDKRVMDFVNSIKEKTTNINE
ncbi:hypothetical protein ACWV26_02650 [Rummeliibacillus sp. JY-2-4R]